MGFLKENISLPDLRNFLQKEGFEDAVLAWKDPEEVLSMRKIDQLYFQYHLRIYSDKEVRGHYEYSSEGNPLKHILEKKFEPQENYFKALLKEHLAH